VQQKQQEVEKGQQKQTEEVQQKQQEVEKGQQKQTEEVQQKQQEVEKGATEADRGGATEAAGGRKRGNRSRQRRCKRCSRR